jgi:hypothetical protein
MNQTEIAKLFPEVIQRTIQPGRALFTIVEVMERFITPLEEALTSLSENFTADQADFEFVILLSYFVDLDRYLSRLPFGTARSSNRGDHFPAGIQNLRNLIKSVPELSRWRGTDHGLKLFLERATGLAGFKISDQEKDPRNDIMPFHIRITCPKGAMAYQELIDRIVSEEKPAFVTHEVVFASFEVPNVDKTRANPDTTVQPLATDGTKT